MPKTTYAWDELSDNVAAENEAGVMSELYTHEPGPYANLFSQIRNDVTNYYQYVGRGVTGALTDDAGDITDTKEYDALGQTSCDISRPLHGTGCRCNSPRFGQEILGASPCR